jgi:hypothetical protein
MRSKQLLQISVCPALTVANGNVVYKQSDGVTQVTFPPYLSGYIATLSCTSGTVAGPSTATCSLGSWTPPVGFCSSSAQTPTPIVTSNPLQFFAS